MKTESALSCKLYIIVASYSLIVIQVKFMFQIQSSLKRFHGSMINCFLWMLDLEIQPGLLNTGASMIQISKKVSSIFIFRIQSNHSILLRGWWGDFDAMIQPSPWRLWAICSLEWSFHLCTNNKIFHFGIGGQIWMLPRPSGPAGSPCDPSKLVKLAPFISDFIFEFKLVQQISLHM